MASKRYTLTKDKWYELDPNNAKLVQFTNNGGGSIGFTEQANKPSPFDSSTAISDFIDNKEITHFINLAQGDKIYLVAMKTDSDVTVSADADVDIVEVV